MPSLFIELTELVLGYSLRETLGLLFELLEQAGWVLSVDLYDLREALELVLDAGLELGRQPAVVVVRIRAVEVGNELDFLVHVFDYTENLDGFERIAEGVEPERDLEVLVLDHDVVQVEVVNALQPAHRQSLALVAPLNQVLVDRLARVGKRSPHECLSLHSNDVAEVRIHKFNGLVLSEELESEERHGVLEELELVLVVRELYEARSLDLVVQPLQLPLVLLQLVDDLVLPLLRNLLRPPDSVLHPVLSRPALCRRWLPSLLLLLALEKLVRSQMHQVLEDQLTTLALF